LHLRCKIGAHEILQTLELRLKLAFSGVLVFVTLRLIISPPMNRTSVSTSNRIPLPDRLNDRPKAPGSPASLKGDPGHLPNWRIGEHQSRTVKPDQLPTLLDQRSLLGLKNPGPSLNAGRIERGHYRQRPNYLWDQPEGF
jgi:hypothetical protein